MLQMQQQQRRPVVEEPGKDRGKQQAPQGVQRIWQTIKRYPIPVVSLLLLSASLILWLTGRQDLANYCLLAIILPGGAVLLWQTLKHFWHREFSVDVIAILAITGSVLLQEYLAGAFIVLMMSGGEALEAFALRSARSSLAALADRAPRKAHIWKGEQLCDIAAEEVEVGMQIVVKPGELIPVDGVVSSGTSNVSEADLTGEPVPVRKNTGDTVMSGSVNLDSVLEVQATARSEESKYAQIINLVREAQEQKAPIHRLADRYSIVFTAATLLISGLAWVVSRDSVYALAVLVVATPCPLILATPIAIMSGIGVGARHALIIKSGTAIEQLGEVDTAVFDKTGTLTLGLPRVTALVDEEECIAHKEKHEMEETSAEPKQGEMNEEKTIWLRLAASVEQLSSHILARAVVDAAKERDLPVSQVTAFEEVFGKGVQGRVTLLEGEVEIVQSSDEQPVHVAVGNRTFMRHLEIPLPSILQAERERRTTLGQMCSFLAIDRRVVALIVLEDVPRANIVELIPSLKKYGIKQTVLLTGDNDLVAQQIGQVAQVDRVVARCLPEDKVATVQELMQQKHHVLMVGDGVNDAPVLATATVGMALGNQGLTAAASAADVVLLSTDILRVAQAVHLGRHVLGIALEGIWIGMGLSCLAMLFAAMGFIPPAAGAILQEGIDVLVILNALRVNRFHV